jgi:phosphoribosyl 1,2-cyclic phosphate phosphodiesterase
LAEEFVPQTVAPQAIVLGSGTSHGVPMLGMRYPAGFLENPRNLRTRSSVLFQGPTGNLLVDCSPEMRIQVTRERIYDIEAVLITHSHADHVMGMDDLRSLCMKTHSAIPVYTLPRYQEDIRRIFPYAFANVPPGVFVPRFDLRDVPAEFSVGGLPIRSFLVDHGKIPVVGLRVGGLAYITDVSHIPESAMGELQGLDTLIIDAVRYEPHPNHFHFSRAVEVAQEIGARQTYFTHLSHDYNHEETNASLPAGIALAHDGLRIAIKI